MQASNTIHGHDCPFRLCDHQKEEVRADALAFHVANTTVPLREAEAMFGAILLLKKVMGREWVQQHVTPEIERPKDPFFRQKFSTPEEQSEWSYRILCLANLFYELVDVPGLQGRIADLRTKSIEQVVFELRMAERLIESGHHVHFVVPKNTKGTDYDLDVWIAKQRVAVEVKCKQDDTPFSDGTLRSTFAKARSQLPKELPGVLMMKLPRPWFEDETIREELWKAVTGFLWNTQRVNVVIAYYDYLRPATATQSLRHESAFSVFKNSSPRIPLPGLADALLHPGDGKPTPTPVFFL
jgi:hypothetical protein